MMEKERLTVAELQHFFNNRSSRHSLDFCSTGNWEARQRNGISILGHGIVCGRVKESLNPAKVPSSFDLASK
jgi:hypothetical protein